jgi:hypothetical protein
VLQPHPASAAGAIDRIVAAVAIDRPRSALRIRFRVEGDVSRLDVPVKEAARRADGLWQHTCFEAFLRADADDGYHEFNFSPSGAWAAYRFSGRRTGRESPEVPAPGIELDCRADALEMKATVAIDSLTSLVRSPLVHVGLAAVIEERDGSHGYWALAHSAAQPDFHDPRTFLLTVPTA